MIWIFRPIELHLISVQFCILSKPKLNVIEAICNPTNKLYTRRADIFVKQFIRNEKNISCLKSIGRLSDTWTTAHKKILFFAIALLKRRKRLAHILAHLFARTSQRKTKSKQKS